MTKLLSLLLANVTLHSIIDIKQVMAVLYAERLIDESLSDDELFALIALKDQDIERAKMAFNIFHNKYSRLLLTLCYDVCSSWRIANSKAIAEDIFQQTMIAIYEHPTYNSSKGKVSTWMAKIAQRKACDLLNLGNSKESYLDEIGSKEYYDDEESDEIITPQKKILADALNTLSEIERGVLMTYFGYQQGRKHLPDCTLKELCDYYKKTSDNIRQIKKRAMDKVKDYIQQNSDLLF